MVVGTLLDGITSLGSKVFDLTRAMTKAGDALQKASLALGSDFRTMNTQLKPSMDGLRGSIEQRFGAAFATLEAVLQGNTAGISKLINQQQLTGTQYQQTAKAFAKLEFALDLSREESNELATRVRDLGAEFNVSTDKLVESISDLKATFPAQKLAGMGKETMEAVATLRAEIPALGEELNAVMRMVFDPSFGTFGQLTALGIGSVREQLANNKDVNAQVEILKNAIATASTSVSQLAAGSKDQFTNIQIAKEVGSETALLFGILNDELDKRAKNPDPMLDFGKTIETLKAEVFVPFKMFFVEKVFPVLVEVSDVLSFIGQKLTQAFTDMFPKLDLTSENLNHLKIGILTATVNILNFSDSFLTATKNIVTGVFPVLVRALVGLANFIERRFPSDKTKATREAMDITLDPLRTILTSPNLYMSQSEFQKNQVKGIMDLHSTDSEFKKRFDEGGGILTSNAAIIQRAKKIAEQMGTERAAIGQTDAGAFTRLFTINQEEMLNNPELLGNKLFGEHLRIALENQEFIRDIAGDTANINRKTIDPFEEATTSEFLSNQSVTIGRVMEGILGITPQSDEERTALMQIQTNYLKAIAEKPSGIFANPLGY